MGLFSFLHGLFGGGRYGSEDLAQRLGLMVKWLDETKPHYQRFTIPKRAGGIRDIDAPNDELKKLQRLILHRVLAGLKAHPACNGFERNRSIVSNARVHARPDVVLRMDIRDFFGSTGAARVKRYCRAIGWDRRASNLLVKLCTWQGGLPQGAPTSPRLSNLVNYQMDARLAGLAQSIGARYTRYADDITFSFRADEANEARSSLARNPKTLDPAECRDDHRLPTAFAIRMTKAILADYGYKIHHKRKLHIRRKHQRQDVTGLVVNHKVNLPRRTRRWLRAVEHHLATGRPATLSAAQLAGWHALQHMVATQSQPGSP